MKKNSTQKWIDMFGNKNVVQNDSQEIEDFFTFLDEKAKADEAKLVCHLDTLKRLEDFGL